MNTSLSSGPASPEFQRHREDFPARLDKLRQLIEDKVHILKFPVTEEQQGSENTGTAGLWRFAVLSEELTFHLQQLQRQTEQELSNICTQLSQIEGRQQLLSSELLSLQEKKKQAEQELKRNSSLHTSTFQLCACRELQVSITDHLLQSERLVFQEEALSTLRNLLTQDLHRYQEEKQRLTRFTQKVLTQSHRLDRKERSPPRESDHSMQGKSETEQENNMQGSEPSPRKSPTIVRQGAVKDEVDHIKKASQKPSGVLSGGSNLRRAGSIKDLISKFSGPERASSPLSPSSGSPKSPFPEILGSPKSKMSLVNLISLEPDPSPAPVVTVTPLLDSSPLRPSSGSPKSPFPEILGSPKSKMSLVNLISLEPDPSPAPVVTVTPLHASSPLSLSSGSPKSPFPEILGSPKSKMSLVNLISLEPDPSPAPVVTVTPPIRKNSQNGDKLAQTDTKTSPIIAGIASSEGGVSEKTELESKKKTQTTDSGRESVADSGMGSESEFDTNKQPESPSEEEPTTPKVVSTSQNPKYQLFLNNEIKTNGVSGREADGLGGGGLVGENGPRLPRLETPRQGMNHFRGSLESLTPREWDTMSDRASFSDNSPRVFHSPYSTSMDYNPTHRMSEFKPGPSPATSELNLFSFTSRSTSPVAHPLNSPRPRYSAYDSLIKRRTEMIHPQQQHQQLQLQQQPQVINTHYSMRSNTVGASPNRKDYIEELTKQMDACQKRNQFLEAESIEMDKERNQIRFEMRNLLVNNEDLLRTNTQLNNEMKRLREQMLEMDREKQAMVERFRTMEIEVKEAREVMVEANNQEYAFNFLQQSLQTQLKDAEESLEKEQQHSQSLSEKLWHAERQLEELEFDKGTKSKKASELNSTIERLEKELSEALQVSTQATAELNLQQKLRDDGQVRVEELEESLLEKEQEVVKLQALVNKLQGEVSGKLIDKERTLEEEIQLRERIQLQCKQAERSVEDLQMELHTTIQGKEDLAKQLKQAQEKMIDLETDLEELHDSEQRWAAKHKRAIEQTEQLQLKLIQEKDMNDVLETDKAAMERQLRELRSEVEELQSSRVQEDVISRAETRVKELENTLRTEERNKSVLGNSVSKLERRINELTDQMEEEHRIANEQKELMAQRIRSLKRQVNEAEEEASRKEAQYRHTQRELAEERETSGRLQRQLLDQHMQTKRMDSLTIRQTLDNLRLDLSVDDEDEEPPKEEEETTTGQVTKV